MHLEFDHGIVYMSNEGCHVRNINKNMQILQLNFVTQHPFK